MRRLLEWLVPEENPAGVIYGLLVIGGLLAAESGTHESYLDTVISAVIAPALYWLAHAYATILGRRLEGTERLTLPALVRALGHDWSLIRGAAIPLLALLVAWGAQASQETGVNAALWTTVASLVLFELIAGIRAHSTASELTLEVLGGMAMGLGILALKVVLHH